jgi:MYXO-CTERM domain-containing protein
MKRIPLLPLVILSACVATLHAQTMTYTDGRTNVQNASGPAWVGATLMFQDIVSTFGGAPGPSGATGATSTDIDLFDGGGMDITLLTWEFGPMSLTGIGVGDSATVSPGDATAGFEDYRYNDLSGAAAANLTFYYNEVEWLSGYVTRFLITVPNRFDPNATGTGTAYITNNTAAGTGFFNEIMTITGGSGELAFNANNFVSTTGTDPESFTSTGSVTIVSAVPEPATWTALAGAAGLAMACFRRRRRVQFC